MPDTVQEANMENQKIMEIQGGLEMQDIIYVSDNISFRTIKDICQRFDIPLGMVKRGFQYQGGIKSFINPNYLFWWPIGYKPEGWQNKIFQNGLYIQESHTDTGTHTEHYYSYKDSEQKRPAFFKDLRVNGSEYTFFGVYCVDKTKSSVTNGIFWKRISEGFNVTECHEV
jgi:hypothetical protein